MNAVLDVLGLAISLTVLTLIIILFVRLFEEQL